MEDCSQSEAMDGLVSAQSHGSIEFPVQGSPQRDHEIIPIHLFNRARSDGWIDSCAHRWRIDLSGKLWRIVPRAKRWTDWSQRKAMEALNFRYRDLPNGIMK